MHTAIAHGGALTCVSVLRRMGVWTLSDSEAVHVWMGPGRHARAHSGCRCVNHYQQGTPPLGAASLVNALLHFRQCEGDEASFAAFESAWRKRLLSRSQRDQVRAGLPAGSRWLVDLARPDADSGLESLLRLRLHIIGVRLDCQVSILGVGRVDFVVGGRLIIEADGKENHDGPTKRHKDLFGMPPRLLSDTRRCTSTTRRSCMTGRQCSARSPQPCDGPRGGHDVGCGQLERWCSDPGYRGAVTMTTTLLRTGSALAAVGLLIGMLSACTPESKPTPKPTKSAAFATDEEAFAAAEETYKAYVDATNAVDLQDPDSFDAVFSWLTGSALAEERETFSQFRAEGLSRSGEGSFDTFTPTTFDQKEVVASVCLDVSDIELSYADGTSAVPVDRPARTGRSVTFVPADSETGLRIASHDNAQDDFKC
ncbi:hypothetical protein AB0N64_03330 [Microbacterium sp. NPDC089318]